MAVVAVIRSSAACDTKSVSVAWNEAHETFSIKNCEFEHAGFWSNTRFKTTLAATSNPGERDYEAADERRYSLALFERREAEWHHISSGTPACATLNQRPVGPAAKVTYTERYCRTLFRQVFADSDGLVLFDHDNHLEIMLPKPILTKTEAMMLRFYPMRRRRANKSETSHLHCLCSVASSRRCNRRRDLLLATLTLRAFFTRLQRRSIPRHHIRNVASGNSQ